MWLPGPRAAWLTDWLTSADFYILHQQLWKINIIVHQYRPVSWADSAHCRAPTVSKGSVKGTWKVVNLPAPPNHKHVLHPIRRQDSGPEVRFFSQLLRQPLRCVSFSHDSLQHYTEKLVVAAATCSVPHDAWLRAELLLGSPSVATALTLSFTALCVAQHNV